jgi:hypothetical protein
MTIIQFPAHGRFLKAKKSDSPLKKLVAIPRRIWKSAIRSICLRRSEGDDPGCLQRALATSRLDADSDGLSCVVERQV